MKTLFTLLLFTVAATGQSPQAAAADVEIVSVEAVDRITDISGRVWGPAQPDMRAVIIRMRLTRGVGYETSDFSLTHGPAAKPQRVICAGHTAQIPGGWVIDEQKGSQWSLFPGGSGKLEGLGILFVIPRTVTKATLFYKGQPVGAAFDVNAGETPATPAVAPRIAAVRRTLEYHTVDMRTMRPRDPEKDVLLLIEIDGISIEDFQKFRPTDIHLTVAGDRRETVMSGAGLVNGRTEIHVLFSIPKAATDLKLFVGQLQPLNVAPRPGLEAVIGRGPLP